MCCDDCGPVSFDEEDEEEAKENMKEIPESEVQESPSNTVEQEVTEQWQIPQ